MKSRWTLILIAANLCALILLAFAYPHLMVSAGVLLRGHERLATSCFECHAAGRGADPARCIRCHSVDRIGVQSTTGAVVPNDPSKRPFHSDLTTQDCMKCHSDHRGVQGGANSRLRFEHAMLRPDVRERCESCHAAPKNAIHANRRGICGQCHSSRAWKPAGIDHAKLSAKELANCQACHASPADALHRQFSLDCSQCHAPGHWKPATFDHDRFWPLDGNHNVSCVTCHASGDYRRYSCYGCHEHAPGEMMAKHAEEGIQDIAACVRCHRSGSGEGGD
jgi:hypothetical protein